MQRTPSTHPSWLLGVPSLEPDIAARAALSASASSHFPCPGRLLCVLAGESASRTGIPSDARCLVMCFVKRISAKRASEIEQPEHRKRARFLSG